MSNHNRVTVGVGDVVRVRLGLLPGMTDKEPTAEAITEMNNARRDPGTMDKLLNAARKERKNEDLSAAELSEQHWLYPRSREARVTYVDRTDGGTNVQPSGAPGKMKPAIVGFINLEVKTVGSTVMQPAVGHYPKWAQETFRLDHVPFYSEEPKDAQEMDIAYPVPDVA